jgi:hypothetical protein
MVFDKDGTVSVRPNSRQLPDDPSDEPDAARGRGAIPGDLLLHPIALISLAVVIVNDRVVKVRSPGLVSGKLSDFAGLIYFPLFVATVVEIVRRPFKVDKWWATVRLVGALAVVTGVVFALAKVWTPWADGYRTTFGAIWWPVDALTAVVRGDALPNVGRLHLAQDPTDLFALPALVVPVVVARLVTRGRLARAGDRPN